MQAILQLDRSIVVSWNDFLAARPVLDALVDAVAVYGVYLIPIIWIVWWFIAGKKERELLMSSMLAGLLAWQVLGNIIKLFVSRARPDEILPIKELLFRRPDNSFPSDHAAFFGGIAFFFLFHGHKKPGVIFLILGVAIGSARIATAVHYPTDILVGLLDGAIMAWIIHLFHSTLAASVWDYLINLARKLRLA